MPWDSACYKAGAELSHNPVNATISLRGRVTSSTAPGRPAKLSWYCPAISPISASPVPLCCRPGTFQTGCPGSGFVD